MSTVPPARSAAAWRGPLRAGLAVLLVGFLVIWLIAPLGNPCPDLAKLPRGSSASSSPSFSPPGSRTCTYTTGAIHATARYLPWLDWIVLVLLAAAAAGAVRVLSPAGRSARAQRPSRAPRAPKPRASSGREPPQERDAAERERARRERAARDRARRGR